MKPKSSSATEGNKQEGKNMNAYAIRPTIPFASAKPLKRTPSSDVNKEIAAFIDSHEFSFDVNADTKDLVIGIKEKDK